MGMSLGHACYLRPMSYLFHTFCGSPALVKEFDIILEWPCGNFDKVGE